MNIKMFFTHTQKKGYLKNGSLKGSLGNQKWFFFGKKTFLEPIFLREYKVKCILDVLTSNYISLYVKILHDIRSYNQIHFQNIT